MSVFDLLTEEDKNKIVKYIELYGPLNDSCCGPDYDGLPNVLKEWDTQKSKNLQKLFGDNLILSRPYTYTISDDGVIKEIEDVLYQDPASFEIFYSFYNRIKQIVYNSLDFPKEGFDLIPDIFNARALGVNAYTGDNLKLVFPDNEVWKISTGMKPIKIISKIIARYGNKEDEERFEAFRIWHSQLLNQIHLDGTLSLSIHPLDFMTMSDNDNSWSSCMRWMADGESPGDYRMGTVECMNSPYIIVAYLHNQKKPMKFYSDWRNPEKDLYWNKKKWRELFIVQNGIISEIKGYPYQDENLTNTTLMWIKELAQKNLGWEYDDVEVNIASSYEKDDKINMFKFSYDAYMYNDFGTLPKHRGRINLNVLNQRVKDHDDIYTVEYTPRDSIKEHIIYEMNCGGKATCMCCGQFVPYIDNRSNSVFCLACENTQICPCCGEYFEGEGFYISNYDDPICSYCFDYECEIDDLSENKEYNGSMVDIYFCLGENKDGEPVFFKNHITTLDPEWNNYEYEKLFTAPPKTYSEPCFNWHNTKYYVTLDMVKDMDWFENVFDIEDNFEYLAELYEVV